MVFGVLRRLLQRLGHVPRNDVVQQPVGLVLQALDFAAIANGQQRTVKADAIAEKNIF
jgi:hypothetical protein